MCCFSFKDNPLISSSSLPTFCTRSKSSSSSSYDSSISDPNVWKPYERKYSNECAGATSINGIYSVERILLLNAGVGYTVAPTITISGSDGIGAAATCSINTDTNGVYQVTIIDNGNGYATLPNVSFTSGGGSGASAISVLEGQTVDSILISSGGSGYSSAPTVNIAQPNSSTGIGTFIYNEVIVGSSSGATAYVREWDADTNQLKISINSGQFITGEVIVGTASSATFVVYGHDLDDTVDKYRQNEEIEEEADTFLDFSEDNPFGNY